MFENKKKGNYYEVTRDVTNKFKSIPTEGSIFGEFTIMLDSDSIEYESNVNHILDVIGTIGGSFELVHYSILIIYITLRKNLYFYTMLKRIYDFKMSQNNSHMYASRINNQMLRYVDKEETKMKFSKDQKLHQTLRRNKTLNPRFYNKSLETNSNSKSYNLRNRDNLTLTSKQRSFRQKPYSGMYPYSIAWKSTFCWWLWRSSNQYKSYKENIEQFKLDTSLENIIVSINTLKTQVKLLIENNNIIDFGNDRF